MQQQRLINNSSQLNTFRAIILPIFRSTRLCVTASGITHPRCCRPATSWVHYTTSCNTQSTAPEDGQNNCPKHVELTGIINKPLLLHLVCCIYYLYQWCTVKQILGNEIYLLIKYIKSVLWRVAKRLSYIEDARCLKANTVVIKHLEMSADYKFLVSWATFSLCYWYACGRLINDDNLLNCRAFLFTLLFNLPYRIVNSFTQLPVTYKQRFVEFYDMFTVHPCIIS